MSPCPCLLQLLLAVKLFAKGERSTCAFECAGEEDSVSFIQYPRSSMVLGASRQRAWPSHFWSRRGGDDKTSSSTPFSAPSDFSGGPSWIWKNELDEQVRHSPLIDRQKNIYVSTATIIRKFDPSGKIMWSWHTSPDEGKLANSPALQDDAIFAVTSFPGKVAMYSIDMETGKVKWRKHENPSLIEHDDCGTVTVHKNVMLVPLMKNVESGANTILYAVNASNGNHIWNYTVDDNVWNFSPASLGDGTLMFATTCGGVYRMGWDGTLIYRKGTPSQGHTCSTGGGALGPNGVFYVEYNNGLNEDGHGAHILAYDVRDGSLLWSKTLEPALAGWQYPAVGKLGQHVAVIIAAGGITQPPNLLKMNQEPLRKEKRLRNAVLALDGASGEELWRFEEEPWDRIHAAGDIKKLPQRLGESQLDWRRDTGCSPDVQGIPVIAGDGTIYMSSGHTGELKAIRDSNGDGSIDNSEVSTFNTHNCFLNSPSLAPDMLVVAPCWGPMYVFKSDTDSDSA